MSSLTSLQGSGGGRIPMDGCVYAVSRHELTAIIDAMPFESCRAMHLAACQGDRLTAQRLLREAAAAYFATPTPAATMMPTRRARRSTCTTPSNL